ncbi:MAG TPA: DUF6285 domain-containing protein [Acidimicrobiales bacterium]|nr:DUF6285 domain-containing protein [Acidimicrobiales bacterium]
MTGGAGVPEPPGPGASPPGGAGGGWPPHDVPGAADLVAAVGEFLEAEVLEATEGRTRFLVRVAVNALAMVGRELVLGPAMADEHRRRLAALGVADERALAAAIRSGALDERAAEVRAVVRATVADKLAVANPRYLEAGPGPGA